MSLLAAIASIPEMVSALDRLAGALERLGRAAVAAEAAKRREAKDEEVDAIINALLADELDLVRDEQARKLGPSDGEAGL